VRRRELRQCQLTECRLGMEAKQFLVPGVRSRLQCGLHGREPVIEIGADRLPLRYDRKAILLCSPNRVELSPYVLLCFAVEHPTLAGVERDARTPHAV